MQLNDKIVEVNNDLVEYGNLCLDINTELDKPRPNIIVLKDLFEKKKHIWNRRSKHLDELSVLIGKANEDWAVKMEKHWPSEEKK